MHCCIYEIDDKRICMYEQSPADRGVHKYSSIYNTLLFDFLFYTFASLCVLLVLHALSCT